jgi:hypothetical protein
MNIPLPEMSHWNKIMAGKKVSTKPLPKAYKSENEIQPYLRVVEINTSGTAGFGYLPLLSFASQPQIQHTNLQLAFHYYP